MLSEQATPESRDSANSADILVKPDPWRSFWRTLIRFDRQKIQPSIAFRNTLGVALPLIVGISLGSPLGGIAVASGALNVSYSDRADPYDQRARRMLVASVVTAFSVLVGGLIGRNNFTAIAAATVWAFAAGMLVALGTTEADLGVTTVVMLVIFSAQPLTAEQAVNAGLLALGGGLLQTAFSLALWPVRRYEPERRVLGELYLELSKIATLPATATGTPPGSGESTAAQEMLSTLGQDHTVEGERYRSLLNQAERARLCLLTLGRLRRRMHREQRDAAATQFFDQFIEASADILKAVGHSLIGAAPIPEAQEWVKRLDELAGKMRRDDRSAASLFLSALIEDALFQMDALGGQLRSVVDLVDSSNPGIVPNSARPRSDRLATLRSTNRLGILRANLNLQSNAFRHAIRLAACLVIGDVLGRSLDWRRSYWLPMTIVIVLKPDFTATFSRGVLRLAGTFAGLILATVLFHFVHPTMYEQALLIALCMFALRLVGPANYGIFVSNISALIVLLVAMTGISPREVIAARGMNTAAGGILALLAYWLWPTWERKQAGETLAQMLDAYRAYFRRIATAYHQPGPTEDVELDRLRLAARLSRSNLEASADRLSAEPGISAQRLNLASAILASSHRLIRAIMALDSGLSGSERAPAREAFRAFANDVDLTLYYLASALRGSSKIKNRLPDLRDDHRRLLEAGGLLRERYALVNIETDRITNSLNTLSEQILRWLVKTQPARQAK